MIRSKLFLAGLLVSLSPMKASAASPAQCFGSADSMKASFPIFSQMQQPSLVGKSYNLNFTGYPAGNFASVQITYDATGMTSPPDGSGFQPNDYYWLWANRCAFLTGTDGSVITPVNPANLQMGCGGNVNQTPNGNDNPYTPQNDSTYPRVIFSSYYKADTCTRLQLRRIANADGADYASLSPVAAAANLKLYDLSDPTLANPVDKMLARQVKFNGKTKTFFVDLCILAPVGVSADTKGIIVDWEVYDNRKPSAVTILVQSLGTIARRGGKKLILMTNDLASSRGTSGGTKYSHNGLDSTNIATILGSIDGISPINWSGATLGAASGVPASARSTDFASDWCAQEKIMNLPTSLNSKVIINVSLLDLQMNATPSSGSECGALPAVVNEPQWIYERVLSHGYGGIMFWRNSVTQGGACSAAWSPGDNSFPPQYVNQSIACLSFGKCDGKYQGFSNGN